MIANRTLGIRLKASLVLATAVVAAAMLLLHPVQP